MTDDPLLAAVLANPADDAPRLVYADWLDERGEADRAEFLRADCRLSQSPFRHRRALGALGRLRELSGALDPDWVALVSRVPFPDAVRAALQALEVLVSGANYHVSLGLWRIPGRTGADPGRYVRPALGPEAVVGEVRPVAGPDAAADVGRCLRYFGDPAAGPDPATLDSPEVHDLIGRAVAYVDWSAAEAARVWEFTLRAGHPFHPVWWDFAYLWEKPWGAVVFVGSSSD